MAARAPLPVTTRAYTAAERRADRLIHILGIAFAAIAAPALVVLVMLTAHPAITVSTALPAALLYAVSLVGMILASAAYNLAPEPPVTPLRRFEALRRLDHGMIFVKIAGTYTPFAAVSMAKGSGPALLGAVWVVALIGAVVKVAAPRRLELVSVALYLALGWSFLLVAQEATASIKPSALTLLAGGGALYTVGVGFHLWRKLPYQNAIWHLHVLIATILMYAAVVIEIA